MTYDMDTVVEATSLSQVTEIATNPPAHPNAPTDYPRLPLVLYIARVPGSRDVFLTPIKPREKVVTAEDVQSSLYYIHVNCQEDYEEKPALPARPQAPLTPPYPVDDFSHGQQRHKGSPKPKQIARKPIGSKSDSGPPVPQHGLGSVQSEGQRRPLPSPPAEEQPMTSTTLHADNVRLLRCAEHSDDVNPYERRYGPAPGIIDPATLPDPGSLTVIRRDPASNEQWNVASIHDPPVQEVSSASLRNPSATQRTKRGGAPLYLDISNPSYVQFDNHERTGSRISTASSTSSDSDPPLEGIFRRRLYMPGSQYGEHQYGHSRFGSTGSSLGEDLPIRRTMRGSVDMSLSFSSPSYDRQKAYTFTCPWDGRCEFSAGATGRSLKCRHQLPISHGGNTADVSELRFNLPTAQKNAASVLSDKRSSYFHRLHGRAQSSEDGNNTPSFIISDDGKLDLTLGQEKAGGGFGGKQAKLGKLIIEPEGLKMLDLLVAANVGLWWRAYEKL
ncbi:hypothetical protein DOTSEDRAFT_155021 [Dothistroma septosporum NZE10]|uniref:Uncharacterized protein n=1 Tax=Dothistroma septosporum (strain NZE10 / CBS 128990) TaxID=675120 RepID=N1PI84_DOTSN|nr:hypothetical protein DOTSEDRAFT_155021 [Dothistroma septosporum NZE10]